MAKNAFTKQLVVGLIRRAKLRATIISLTQLLAGCDLIFLYLFGVSYSFILSNIFAPRKRRILTRPMPRGTAILTGHTPETV